MYNVTKEEVFRLREETGGNLMLCKKALISTEGNMERAIKIVSEKSVPIKCINVR